MKVQVRKKLMNTVRIKIGLSLNIFFFKSKGLFSLKYLLFVINETAVASSKILFSNKHLKNMIRDQRKLSKECYVQKKVFISALPL